MHFNRLDLPNGRNIQRRIERHIATIRRPSIGHPILILVHAERLECVHRNGHFGRTNLLLLLLNGLLGGGRSGSQQLLGMNIIFIVLMVDLLVLDVQCLSLDRNLLGQLVIGLYWRGYNVQLFVNTIPLFPIVPSYTR